MVRRILRWGLGLVAVPVVAIAVAGAAYVIDRAVTDGEVVRNVTFEGRSLSGLDESEVAAIVEEIGAERIRQPIDLVLPDLTITATAAELGFGYDTFEVVKQAMTAGRSDDMATDVRRWWRSWRRGVDLVLALEFDPSVVEDFVAAHPERIHRLPVEPWFTGSSGAFVVQDPMAGEYLDAAPLVEALAAAAGTPRPPAFVEIPWARQPSSVGEAELAEALAEAERLATRLTVVVNDRPVIIGPGSVRRWIDSATVDGEISPVFAADRVEPQVEELLAPLVSEAAPPTFAVVDGEVVYELGIPAYRCCAPGITPLLFAAAAGGGATPLELPVRLVDPDAGHKAAKDLGVTQLVSEFTTHHQCCEARVNNIHRIADLIRGQFIEPRGRFSVNEFIGPRTAEKGFVPAGTIQSGYFVDDVGGGISQFATTMFNAAFLAGLDFDEYRAHSIYISRYPYGREATLNFPSPDLAVVNTTPYGILIWTEYTGTSITVQMYSTPYWEVEQTGQSTTWIGSCRRVETLRTRTAPDGTVLEDSVFAVYRPAEGLDCNRRQIDRLR